ncbi:MAG TPA: alpha/beta fold hydrolase [Acidimicrobiales bacterium]|nr:alpha/beta fold hydrolase [Acidimicrobiales bacterium]
MRGRGSVIIVAVGMLAGVLLAPPLVPGTGASASPVPPARIAWSPCPHTAGYRCGTLPVPLDYRHPSRGSLRLAVIEHPVAHSKGVVIVNPGGPGESGVLILPLLALSVPAVVRHRFTLVSFDERGTGSSEPLLCGPSVAAAGSAVAGTVAATRVFANLERSCRSAYPALFPTVTTTNSARDMNRLRVALGAGRINYYGLSYGTVLGSVYRQLFPTHVRSMVLDGAVDANLSLTTDAVLEAPAIENAIQYDLRRCTATAGCPLGAHPVTLYRDLEQRLARSPLPAPGGGDTTPVTGGDLTTATLLYLSVPGLTPGYFPALASAAAGDGAPLRAVAVTLETDLNGQSLVGPLWTITCNDAATHPDATATAALARSLAARDPLGGAEAVANNLIACPGWTGDRGPVAHLHPNGAPTPLVIGNTGDPNTPYAAARDLTSAIGGRLVTFVGYGHSWLLNGSTNACMRTVVGDYLVSDSLPARGTRCAG